VRIEIEGKTNAIKSSYFLKANSNHKKFSIKYSKELKLKVKQNVLILQTPFNEIQEMNAIAFQYINGIKKSIECNFVLNENNSVTDELRQRLEKITGLHLKLKMNKRGSGKLSIIISNKAEFERVFEALTDMRKG
jgi:hypothetical protein